MSAWCSMASIKDDRKTCKTLCDKCSFRETKSADMKSFKLVFFVLQIFPYNKSSGNQQRMELKSLVPTYFSITCFYICSRSQLSELMRSIHSEKVFRTKHNKKRICFLPVPMISPTDWGLRTLEQRKWGCTTAERLWNVEEIFGSDGVKTRVYCEGKEGIPEAASNEGAFVSQ